MKIFKGRVVVPSGNGKEVKAEALVSARGFNTLASFQKALMFGDKQVRCSDQNNSDIYGKPMAGRALCLPQTIGSTTGGMIFYCAAARDSMPACLLFSRPIDSLAAAGAILAGVWTDNPVLTIDSLGDDFLAAVKTGSLLKADNEGTVTVE